MGNCNITELVLYTYNIKMLYGHDKFYKLDVIYLNQTLNQTCIIKSIIELTI